MTVDDAEAIWTLVRPAAGHAAVIARWSLSVEEAGMWCSRAEHPFPAEALLEWWKDTDVHPQVLLDPWGTPVAYGELWDDPSEDEYELARLIVDTARRRSGVGTRLVGALVDTARRGPRSKCVIRVVPANDGAVALYRHCGFRDVDEATTRAWNEGQPRPYVWLTFDWTMPRTVARPDQTRVNASAGVLGDRLR